MLYAVCCMLYAVCYMLYAVSTTHFYALHFTTYSPSDVPSTQQRCWCWELKMHRHCCMQRFNLHAKYSLNLIITLCSKDMTADLSAYFNRAQEFSGTILDQLIWAFSVSHHQQRCVQRLRSSVTLRCTCHVGSCYGRLGTAYRFRLVHRFNLCTRRPPIGVMTPKAV